MHHGRKPSRDTLTFVRALPRSGLVALTEFVARRRTAPLADGTPTEIVIAPEGIPTRVLAWHVFCNSSGIMNSTALAISFLESLHPRLHVLLYLLAFWLLYRTRIVHIRRATECDIAAGAFERAGK